MARCPRGVPDLAIDDAHRHKCLDTGTVRKRGRVPPHAEDSWRPELERRAQGELGRVPVRVARPRRDRRRAVMDLSRRRVARRPADIADSQLPRGAVQQPQRPACRAAAGPQRAAADRVPPLRQAPAHIRGWRARASGRDRGTGARAVRAGYGQHRRSAADRSGEGPAGALRTSDEPD